MPAGELLTRTVQFYLSSFRPLFLTAAAVAAVPTLVGLLVEPAELAIYFVWTMILLAIELAAHSAVLWTAHSLYSGRGVDRPGALMAIVVFGPRYFASAFLLLSLGFLSAWSLVLIPLAVYLVVRLSLFGPAIVLENRSIVEGFRRSWQLVEGRWWRTFGMGLVLFSAPLLASLPPTLLFQADAGRPVLFLANVIATALVIPLLMSFFLILFEDYRRVTDNAHSYEQ
jgi:hypothetical protein